MRLQSKLVLALLIIITIYAIETVPGQTSTSLPIAGFNVTPQSGQPPLTVTRN